MNPLIPFEIVGCEDPLDTNVTKLDANRPDVKTDIDEPTDGKATNGQESEPLQEVFESRSIRCHPLSQELPLYC